MADLSFDYADRDTGGSKRPTEATLTAQHPDHGPVGFLRYLIPRRSQDKIYIDRLEVPPEHRGHGYASQLMDELQRRHPRTPIDHGSRTDDGAAWWASYSRDKKVRNGRTAARNLPCHIGMALNDPNYPHQRAVYATQNLMRGQFPDLYRPLPTEKPPRDAILRRILRAHGHPDADDAFVINHPKPELRRSSVIAAPDQDDNWVPGVALHPDNANYGTLAHEAGHILHHHAEGIDPFGRHDDQTQHGPGFAEHYTHALRVIHPDAADFFSATYPRVYRTMALSRDHHAGLSSSTILWDTGCSEIQEAHYGREAGKGKPRRDAPDVARGAGQADEDHQGDLGPDSGRRADEAGAQDLAPLAEHPRVAADLKKLPKQIQAVYHARVDDLRRGQSHSSTHALRGPLKGWQATSLNWQYRMVHRHVGDELHVLSAGNHDESYDQAIRRDAGDHHTAITDKWPPYLTEREDEYGEKYPVNVSRENPRGPVGTEEEAQAAGWVGPYFHGTTKRRARDILRGGFRQPRLTNQEMHGFGNSEEVDMGHTHRTFFTQNHDDAMWFARGNHDDEAAVVKAYLHPQGIERGSGGGFMPSTQVRDVAHVMAIRPSQKRTSKSFLPTQRLFGPTYGLDKRLFDGDKLKEPIREQIIAQFDGLCQRQGYRVWRNWAKIVFFGSEASGWTSPDLIGNSDFDLSIGIDYTIFRRLNPTAPASLSDADLATMITQQMHAELNDPEHYFKVDGSRVGPFDETWFANLLGWNIALIKPYAALDVVRNEWIVRPPELPQWNLQSFPEGPALIQECRAVASYVRAVLKLPEPYRSQQGLALWQHLHSDRGRAFGPQGEGWWDASNVIEKWLSQQGLWEKLVEIMVNARAHPESLNTPADWSNDPTQVRERAGLS